MVASTTSIASDVPDYKCATYRLQRLHWSQSGTSKYRLFLIISAKAGIQYLWFQGPNVAGSRLGGDDEGYSMLPVVNDGR